MARSIDELLKALEADETNGAEVIEVIKGLQADNTKKNNEAKNLRDRMHEAEAETKSAQEKLDKVFGRLDITMGEDNDVDKALEVYLALKKKELDDHMKDRPDTEKELVELRSSMQGLKRDLEKMQKEKDEADKTATLERERRIRTDRDRLLLEALRDAKVIAPSELVALFANKVKTKDDESVVYVDVDGGELTLKEGIAAYLKEHPEFVQNSQTPGGGSGSITGKMAGGLYSLEQIKGMSEEEINRNWDKVQESLRAAR